MSRIVSETLASAAENMICEERGRNCPDCGCDEWIAFDGCWSCYRCDKIIGTDHAIVNDRPQMDLRNAIRLYRGQNHKFDQIKARLGSISKSRMKEFPDAVQKLLTEDLPYLLGE